MAVPTEKASLTEQAAAWLAALDAGTADRAAFERWRAADARRAAAFAQVAAAWTRLDAARLLRQAECAADLDAGADGETAARRPRAVSRRTLMRAAAVAGLVVSGGTAAGLMSRAWARTSAETGIGERRSIVLEDGSRLELNTDTRVAWRLRESERSVWLTRGEIALDVAASGAPLSLHGAVSRTELAEGRYNARLTGTALDLLVVEGRARLAAAGTPAVSAGESALISAAGPAVRAAEPVVIARAEAWRRGELVFSGESLDFAVGEYNRYLARRIIIGDAQLSRLRLGGRFTSADPSQFLRALEASFGIRALDDADTIVLMAGG